MKKEHVGKGVQTHYTILVVEDDEGLNNLIKKSLQRAGFRTHGALNGKEALGFLMKDQNAILLLDFMLPDMTGKQLIEVLTERNCDIPFIMMTGQGDEKIAVEMMKLGAWDYIIKDANLIEILPQIIKRVVNGLVHERKLKAAEQALRESEERYKTLVKTSPDAVTATDLEGNISYVSERTLELHGFENAKELLGKSAFELVALEDREKAAKNLAKTLDKGAIRNAEYNLLRKDGSNFIGELSAALVKDAEGKPNAFIATTRDITERKRAEQALNESKERLLRFMESATDIFILFDSGLNFVDINKAGLKTWGVNKEEVVGKNLSDVSPDLKETGRYGQYMDVIKSGKPFFIDDTVPNPKFGNKHLAVKAFKVGDGLGVIISDITEHKNAEENLKKTMQELERSNKDLEQFVYIASHDLQEPLRTMSSYTKLLKKRYKGKLDSDADEFIEFIVDGSTRMQNLIKDLLEFSRVDKKGRKFKESESQEALRQAVNNLQATIEETSATITTEELPKIFADDVQLVRLFQNLIDNAIKFHGNVPPQVHISAQRREDEWIFSVRDNGLGLDPKYSDKVFTIFQKLHAGEEYRGTGIGLAICKKIVERHCGRIWVDSEPGKGSTFYFSIPSGAIP